MQEDTCACSRGSMSRTSKTRRVQFSAHDTTFVAECLTDIISIYHVTTTNKHESESDIESNEAISCHVMSVISEAHQ